MNEDLLDVKLHCVICSTEIGPERLRYKAVTCSDEHAELRRRLLRKKTDDRQCRFCHKPSTPNARIAFSAFRKWERQNPQLAFPVQAGILQAAGMKLAEISKAVSAAQKKDIAIESALYEHNWGSMKPFEEAELPPDLARALDILRTHYEQEGRPEESRIES